MKPIAWRAAVAIIGLAGAFGLAAGTVPAAAATTPAVHASVFRATVDMRPSHALAGTAPMIAKVPASQCLPLPLHRFVIFNGSCHRIETRTCFAGNEGNFPSIPRHADNGCIFRVWLYTQTGERGQTLCLTHRTATGTLHTDWKSFRIVSNQDPCHH
ncbi:MAG TPA: hypothetical protein VGI64_12395 [Streptosporangiaceae bacterium]|jgi:hypothetical protein